MSAKKNDGDEELLGRGPLLQIAPNEYLICSLRIELSLLYLAAPPSPNSHFQNLLPLGRSTTTRYLEP